MNRFLQLFVLLSLSLLAANSDRAAGADQADRTFQFTYGVQLKDLQPGQAARVWLPVAPTNEDQETRITRLMIPGRPQFSKEPKYGNEILYVEAIANDDGQIHVEVTYHIRRVEVRRDTASPRVSGEEAALFLKPDAKVPITGKPLELIENKRLPREQLQVARTLYDTVNDHMRYSKEGVGWGQGDAIWACDSRYGNCSDFHSLFISLARSQNIPAKFEIGFPLPPARGEGNVAGYHCWAKFQPSGRGWIPVDISEANKARNDQPQLIDYYFGNLTADRVAFTTGRDLILVPAQAGPPINFLIYPYVEVADEPLPAEKISIRFSYRDLPSPALAKP